MTVIRKSIRTSTSVSAAGSVLALCIVAAVSHATRSPAPPDILAEPSEKRSPKLSNKTILRLTLFVRVVVPELRRERVVCELPQQLESLGIVHAFDAAGGGAGAVQRLRARHLPADTQPPTVSESGVSAEGDSTLK